MRRSLHCTFDALKQVVDQGGWQIKALQAFDSIKVRTGQDSKDPFDNYISTMSGDVDPCEEIPYEQECIWCWNDMVGKKIITYKGVDNIDLDQESNDVFTKEVFQDQTSIPSGVFVMDTLDFKPLMRTWPKKLETGMPFSWRDLFEKPVPIPTSNAMVLIDKYIFNCKAFVNGAKNIANILNNTIPSDFIGEYQVLIVFEKTQTESIKDSIAIYDAITEIDNVIRQEIIDKFCDLRIEYIAVEKADKKKMLPEKRELFDAMKRLYNFSHDRRLIANYYNVNASKAFNASDFSLKSDNTEPTAKEGQELRFNAILNGVDNTDCDFWDIPLNSAKSDRTNLAKYIKGIDTLSCFCTTSEEPKPQQINRANIINRLLN